MMKSIYTPLSGANAQERVLEIIANNLANVNTTAFKGDSATFKLIDPEPYKNYPDPLPPANYKVALENLLNLHGNDISYVGISSVERDSSQGPAISTGNPLDLMLEGDGFLTVQTPTGERYTRNGELSLNTDGVLVTKAGDPILGARGNIFLRSEAFEVNHRGEVYQDGQLVDRLLVTRFDNDESLERVGQNYFNYGGPPEGHKVVEHPSVMQGFLEGSNVNPIKNLAQMIIAHRSYEAYQKAIGNYDQMMDKSSNSLGDIRA